MPARKSRRISVKDYINYDLMWDKKKRFLSGISDPCIDGYINTICQYCGQEFTKDEDDLNESEKYLNVACCPYCGGDNPLTPKEIKVNKDNKVKCKYVPVYSMGYEIEFSIPNKENDLAYIRKCKRSLKDTFGFDGRSPFIKEYRSPVFSGENHREVIYRLVSDLRSILYKIDSLGGEIKPLKLKNGSLRTFGVHISFGGDFLNDDIFNIVKACIKRFHPSLNYRYFIIDKWRNHSERIEYRGYSSCNKDLNTIQKLMAHLKDAID